MSKLIITRQARFFAGFRYAYNQRVYIRDHTSIRKIVAYLPQSA